MRGMVNNILTSDNALASDLDRDLRDEYTPAPESSYSSLLLPLRLLKKHISTAPKVITQRNTTNNNVVPLVLPPCSDEKQNRTRRMCET